MIINGILNETIYLQAYFDEGKTYPALEYTTALVPADTDNIMQQMALGQITAEEGTAAIDQGLEASALQLGLDW